MHFTRASENLHLTQPAVSHHIKALEDEIGQSLFDRGKNGIQLTQTGQIVLNYANKIFQLVDTMGSEIESQNHSNKNLLRVSAVTNSLDGVFAPMFPLLRAKFTNLDLSFINAINAETIVEMVRNKEIDIGFIRDGADTKDLVRMPFAGTEFLPFCGNIIGSRARKI